MPLIAYCDARKKRTQSNLDHWICHELYKGIKCNLFLLVLNFYRHDITWQSVFPRFFSPCPLCSYSTGATCVLNTQMCIGSIGFPMLPLYVCLQLCWRNTRVTGTTVRCFRFRPMQCPMTQSSPFRMKSHKSAPYIFWLGRNIANHLCAHLHDLILLSILHHHTKHTLPLCCRKMRPN